MKPDDLDGFGRRDALERRRRNQLLDGVNSEDSSTQFGMRVIWFILGAACAILAFVLFTILLK